MSLLEEEHDPCLECTKPNCDPDCPHRVDVGIALVVSTVILVIALMLILLFYPEGA